MNGPSRWAPRTASGPGGSARERRDDVGLRRGDERRQVGGDAGLEQRLGRARVAVSIGAHEVDAREAVDLEVDEAGRRDPTARTGDADAHDRVVVELDVAGDERAPRRAPPRRRASSLREVGGRLAPTIPRVPEPEVGVDEVQAPGGRDRVQRGRTRARARPAAAVTPSSSTQRPRTRRGSGATSASDAGIGKPTRSSSCAIAVPGANGALGRIASSGASPPASAAGFVHSTCCGGVERAAERRVGGQRALECGERDDAAGLRAAPARPDAAEARRPCRSRGARSRCRRAAARRRGARRCRGAARSRPRAAASGGTCPASGR